MNFPLRCCETACVLHASFEFKVSSAVRSPTAKCGAPGGSVGTLVRRLDIALFDGVLSSVHGAPADSARRRRGGHGKNQEESPRKNTRSARWTRSDSVKGWASCEENEGLFGLFAEAAMFPHCYEQVLQDDGRSADGRLELCSVWRNGVRFQERLLQVPHPKAWGHAWRRRRWWWRLR